MDRGTQVIGHAGHAARLHPVGRSHRFLAAKTPRPSSVNDSRGQGRCSGGAAYLPSSDLRLRPLERPFVDHVRPVLQHRRPLLAVLGLVVDGPDASLFVRQALLDPVRVVASLVQ